MYLTIYTEAHQKHTLKYQDILNTPTNYPIRYKTTIKITNPTPREQLGKLTRNIERAEQGIQDIWNILKPYENIYEKQYYTFKIPKHSGGLRTINAPLDEFKEALTQTKNIFEKQIKCLPHAAAHAYVKCASITQALQKHQQNNSQWFLKLDLTDFFSNCTPKLIYNKLINLFPFYYFTENVKNILKNIIQICTLNNGLPQGTPISPLLTNLVMVSYDYEITKLLKRGTGNHYVYTRYADDMLISSKSNFNWQEIQKLVQKQLQPFKIKTQKTRYGSRAGSNWNLGLMLNKDNNITVGYQKKKTLNAMLNNFLADFTHQIYWPHEDLYTLQGQLGYLKHIEPDYYLYMLQKYKKKYHIDFKRAYKIAINTFI